jgi:hypothetical protein
VIFRKLFLCLIILFFACAINAQQTSNYRIKQVPIKGDTILIDTLSVIPGSFKIKLTNGKNLDSTQYTLVHTESKLILKPTQNRIDSLIIEYRTFPYLFSAPLKHKDPNLIKPDMFGNTNPFTYTIQSKNEDLFKMDGLSKTGSISRGISFGSNQDVVVNSNLNLQLSGHLSNNIDIVLAATDNNIPIQPDGNTQQLQDFDRVFIQLSKEKTQLIAGDFQLTRPTSYFMNFYKKAQGISLSTALNTTSGKELTGIYKTSLSAAVSRGKFARNVIQGIESNQGPYRLKGAENEPFIIVLSGTEKVFIDGKLMDRGQENDYTIDYNTAEVTFTAKQLITKDKRIVVEFQYADRNYARSLVHVENEYETKKLKLRVNLYSEQDSKNQPLQQDLSDKEQQLLSDIGDTLSLAVSPTIDSVGFSNSEVRYKKTDTLVNAQLYSIYQYNINSDSALYRISFSNVGQGNGDYKQIASSANGKVFEWIAPVLGVKQGNFAPVAILITPKQKQMLTAAVDYAFSANNKISVEAAMSNNDINTFSSVNNENNVGYGLKMNIDNSKALTHKNTTDSTKNPLKLISNINYEYLQQHFSAIERFRSVEFERDWNRKIQDQLSDQHIVGATIGLAKKDIGFINYRFNAFIEGSNYNANKQQIGINLKKNGFNTIYDGSILTSKSIINSSFYRHKSNVFQEFKRFIVGYKDEYENNRFYTPSTNALATNSYKFWEWKGYIQNVDTTRNRYGITYTQRNDFALKTTNTISNLNHSAHAQSIGGFFDFLQNPNKQLKLNVAYRTLQIIDSTITIQKPDNSLVSRIEYTFRGWKGLVSSNTFYEIGSGLEVKKEFSYIEVAPGQGTYTWNDYNENGIKELNEFEIAAFSNTATYIKIYTPTLDYVKVYTNQFSETLMLRPAALWSNKKGVRKFIARFANQTAFRIDSKTNDTTTNESFGTRFKNNYNPFLAEAQNNALASLNSSFRNTFFINQLSPVFAAEITYQNNRNKVLLVNGYDTRQNNYTEASIRWNMTKAVWWELAYKEGIKRSKNEFFTTRDYSIFYYETNPKLNYQPNTAFKISLTYKYANKNNALEYGNQLAVINDYGTEIKYNVLKKGSLNMKINYIEIKYNGESNNALSFEMLDALQIGKNITWSCIYQRNISKNLQLNLTYEGRVSENNKAVHTGGAQIRAYF